MIIAPCVETVKQKNIKKKKIGCQGEAIAYLNPAAADSLGERFNSRENKVFGNTADIFV
jgi:hypothetical protein